MERSSVNTNGFSGIRAPRMLAMLVALVALAALVIGSGPVAADPASLTARATAVGAGNFSITVRWNSSTDSGSPAVWVCVGANGDAPIPLASGVSGSQTANFTAPYDASGMGRINRTYIFGLYTDNSCTTLVDNQTVTVRRTR